MADAVEKKARERLREYGIEVEWDSRRTRGPRPARLWRLQTGDRTIPVLATRLPESEWPASGPGDPGRASEGELPRLWYAEYITPQRAAFLRAMEQHYIDTAGNVHIRLPALVLEVQGKVPTGRKRHARRPGSETVRQGQQEVRVWRRPALRLLFHLLCDPMLVERPQREVASLTGCAAGTVMHLYRDLQLLGNLVWLTDKKRRLVPDRALRDRWIVEFGQKLRPKLLLGNFEVADKARWKDFQAPRHDALWGAESAAQRLGADLQPGIQTLYVHGVRAGLLSAAGLRASEQGRVELRRIFWHTTEAGLQADNVGTEAPISDTRRADSVPTDVVPPLLAAADLMATRDGRCLAAARFILSQHLDGLLPGS